MQHFARVTRCDKLVSLEEVYVFPRELQQILFLSIVRDESNHLKVFRLAGAQDSIANHPSVYPPFIQVRTFDLHLYLLRAAL